jgi:gamma-glutamyltranspeptidase / glutathione hydrolase
MRSVTRLTSVAAGLAVLLGLLAPTGAASAETEKVPVAVGTGGAVATADSDATEAGLQVLRAGGNAVDAAVAAAAALGVTEPFSCGIGGGGFMVIYTAGDGEVTTIDHRETAPATMHPESFWEDGAPLSFTDARYSGLSAGVPGTVAGWADALSRHGTMSLREVLQPAIRIARDGFVVDQTFHDQTEANAAFFADVPSSAELFLDPDGTPKDVGSVFTNPDLARTYERIAHLGAKGFYRGAVAEAMVQATQDPPVVDEPQHTWRPGVMTMRDLRGYAAAEREPTRVSHSGFDVYSMGPPSSGGSTSGEALNILAGLDLTGMPREEALHHYLEASRYSFADRNAYLADYDFVEVPLRGLLAPEFADERRALIKPTAADPPVVDPGDPWPHNEGGSGAASPAATVTRDGTTTHLTVSDAEGNVVSYTFTIESTGGNGIVVPGFGFLLNNELTDFNFGSTTHPNRVEGGKRPRSSMSPTIVLADGEPVVALGSPGGARIITTALQLLVNQIDFGMTLPEAIAAPRLSNLNGPTTLTEAAFLGTADAEALEARGHDLSGPSTIGNVTGVAFLPDGRVQAAAEPLGLRGGSAMVQRPAR